MPTSAAQFKPGAIIPILPPPAAEPLSCNAVMVGEKITVHLFDGSRFAGMLQKFLRTEQRLVLTIEGNPTAQALPFANLRLFELPQPRTWTSASTPGVATDGAASPVRYRIKMKDGASVAGCSLGYRRDAAGLYIYPLREDNTYTNAFVPHTSIADYAFENAELPVHAQTQTPAAPAKAVIDSPEALEEALIHHVAPPKLRLGEILVKEALITQEQLDEALAKQKALRAQGKNMQIGQVLMELGTLDLAAIMQALSERLGIPYINLDKFKFNPEAIQYVPEEMVRKHHVVPIHFFDNKLVVAIENPLDWHALDEIRFHCNLLVEQVMASHAAIERAISTLYSAPDLQESLQDFVISGGNDDDEREVEYDESAVQDNVIVKLVNKIIIDACNQRASDIHIEPYPGKNKTVVRIRKDGVLKNYYEIPSKMRNAVVARIKIMADLDISEKRKPQDGKIDFKKFGPLKIELRIATIPTTADQEDIVMRILASGEPVPLDKLGLSARNAKALRSLVTKPYGLFLVCGPTGSGKTTTLHSVLGYLNTSERKIWTAEDPVEITQRGLRQVVVKPKIGLTFAAAMRAFLRADPDVIMVGEMRDKETTGMGIEASLTGHMVLSTLHTNSAPETVTRLLDMGMDPFNFADALLGIVAQRLTRRLCEHCKEAYTPDAAEIDDLLTEYCYELLPRQAPPELRKEVHERILNEWKESFLDASGNFKLCHAKGCPTCDGTGFKGRLGIHELLTATDAIKKKIHEEATVSELFETAIGEGMRTLKQDGIEKVMQGLTDIRTVRTACIR
ncbi:MAG: Flp pilus assembly complex ATPase component TadA [Chromatiales bacterium]|jgi:type II secretory ATPase GspE/PulE/Tfp pilus assembly ATPase PilB-like protein|nr:Flp pilus assembly complex ATPase component TadA [Chromatiales bacterium]